MRLQSTLYCSRLVPQGKALKHDDHMTKKRVVSSRDILIAATDGIIEVLNFRRNCMFTFLSRARQQVRQRVLTLYTALYPTRVVC
jgi:hypothetical protein